MKNITGQERSVGVWFLSDLSSLGLLHSVTAQLRRVLFTGASDPGLNAPPLVVVTDSSRVTSLAFTGGAGSRLVSSTALGSLDRPAGSDATSCPVEEVSAKKKKSK